MQWTRVQFAIRVDMLSTRIYWKSILNLYNGIATSTDIQVVGTARKKSYVVDVTVLLRTLQIPLPYNSLHLPNTSIRHSPLNRIATYLTTNFVILQREIHQKSRITCNFRTLMEFVRKNKTEEKEEGSQY